MNFYVGFRGLKEKIGEKDGRIERLMDQIHEMEQAQHKLEQGEIWDI